MRAVVFVLQNLLFALIIGLFFVALWSYVFRHESNYCEMTYMFENPTYHRIEMPDDVQAKYRRYSLYSYCEGVRCQAHERNHFVGSPVLFIVGNADSYRQVRSLGSVAYRMGDKQRQLDFFSIDFNEELSALFGGVLEPQAEFVAHAIRAIRALYKTEQSVILVGNSIGGLLSRAIFLQPSHRFDPSTVRLIITQATPHQAPVIHSDRYVMNFYARVNEYWRSEWNKSLQHVVLLSLAGGDRDHLVRSDLCSLNGLTDESRSIDVLTSAVPHVWTSTDHRCIVWCRQLVLTTTRALLEITQTKNPNTEQTMKILRSHFFPTVDLKRAASTSPTALAGQKDSIAVTEPTLFIRRKEDKDYVISLQDSKYHTIIIHAAHARIYLQNDEGVSDITEMLEPIPPTYGSRKAIRFDRRKLGNDLRKYHSIRVRLENQNSQVDVYQTDKEEQTVGLSTFGSQTLSFNQAGYVKLVFPTLAHLWQVYNAHLTSNSQQAPLMRFHVPWSNEDLYNLVTLRNPSSPSSTLSKALQRQMRLKLHRLPHSSPPNEYPSLELFLDGKSSYTLDIGYSFPDILAQLVRYYVFLLPTFLFTVLCISYSMQVYDARLRVYQTMLAWQIHLPIAILITILYQIVILLFPSADFVVNIHSNGYYFFLLPFILYFVALSLWALISFVLDYLMLDITRTILLPAVVFVQNEINQQFRYMHYMQWVVLIIPLLSTIMFSGSNGHIALFLVTIVHVIWRGTLNRRLREVLTSLLLLHGLLVGLNCTGFVVHVKSVLAQGLLPLPIMMSDPSFLSAICCIGAFYLRFLLDRSRSRRVQTIKAIFLKHNRLGLLALAMISQIGCSYSMYYLWPLISVIFIHAAVIFFAPTHQE